MNLYYSDNPIIFYDIFDAVNSTGPIIADTRFFLSSVMRHFKILFILFLSLILSGCRKGAVVSNDQAIFFQFDYVNYSWGYEHYGFFIDAKGNILVYDNPEKWNFPDADYNLSSEQVMENIATCKPSGTKVSEEELKKYAGYINNIASSKVTALKNVAEDAGSSEFICYRYSAENSMYKGSLIKMEGDFTCENLNFYSKKVVVWMEQINKDIQSGLN